MVPVAGPSTVASTIPVPLQAAVAGTEGIRSRKAPADRLLGNVRDTVGVGG